jgi:hypothetical protein
MRDMAEQVISNDWNILSSQFFSGRPDRVRIGPLRRVACAVLADAIRVFQTDIDAPQSNRRHQIVEAQEWLLGPQGDGPFSFENVCYLLDMDRRG